MKGPRRSGEARPSGRPAPAAPRPERSSVWRVFEYRAPVGTHDVRTVLPIVEEVRKKIGASAFVYDPDVAMLSVVGEGLATSPGTAGRVFAALAEAGVNIDLISTSSITITCVVRQADVERAVRSLHSALQLEQEP